MKFCRNIISIIVAAMIIITLFSFAVDNINQDDDKELPRVILTLKSGEKIKGYLAYKMYLSAHFSKVYIYKSLKDTTSLDYETTDIERLVFLADEKNPRGQVWLPLKTRIFGSAWKKKIYDKPKMLKQEYVGKHVIAYTVPIMTQSLPTPSSSGYTGEGMLYYCLVKGTDIARVYWMYDSTAKLVIGGKAYVKKIFKDYPELKKEFKTKKIDLKRDPISVVRVLDEIIEKRSQK